MPLAEPAWSERKKVTPGAMSSGSPGGIVESNRRVSARGPTGRGECRVWGSFERDGADLVAADPPTTVVVAGVAVEPDCCGSICRSAH